MRALKRYVPATLFARSLLGRDVFARGAPEPHRIEVPVIPPQVTETLAEIAARAEALTNPLVQAVLTAFPGAKITAIRATFTTGHPPAKVITTAICNNTLKVSRILGALKLLKLSAQSPPCSKKALPSAT